jgi:hypothetical protein
MVVVSKRRLEANRRNALLGTGPRTPHGKSVSRNNALRHGLARPVAHDPHAARRIEQLAEILAGQRNDPWFRELARNVAEALVDLARIRDVRFQILRDLGEFETIDPGGHAAAAGRFERLWRYEQRILRKHRKALRALRSATSSAQSLALEPWESPEPG